MLENLRKLLIWAMVLMGTMLCACTSEDEASEQIGSIYGIVTELGTAEPMKAIGVELYKSDKMLLKTVTFDDGHFEFKDLAMGDYQVNVMSDEYEQTEKGLVTVEAGRQARIDLQVKRKETYMAVYTSDATVIGNKVMLNGRYTYNDWQVSNPSEVGFVYSTQNNPKNGGITVTCNDVDNTTKTFSKTIEDLAMGTYYVKAYAKNSYGTTYGAVKEFVITGYPAVSTLAASNITETAATLNGHIDYVGTPAFTERGFVYSSTFANPTVEDPESATTKRKVSGSSEDFSANVAGLTTNKTYYVRAYVSNSKGTSYGNILTLKPQNPQYVIIDNLMIQKEDLGEVYWDDAYYLCKNSRVAGYSDWRLPTRDELIMMYNARSEIPNLKADLYWSSTDDDNAYWHWACNFSDGSQSSHSKDRDHCVRAVRTVK